MARVIDRENAFWFRLYSYTLRNYKASIFLGDEKGGQFDTSRGMPTKGSDFVSYLGPHHILEQAGSERKHLFLKF